nr:T9SS type A sorting domain-containing protein [Saprospiraceae bacterium]
DGLDQLTSQTGFFTINGNPALTDLTALASLTAVGPLDIIDNDLLTNLSGLHNITAINGSLTVSENALLPNLNAFQQLNSIGGTVYFQNNPALTSLAGLSQVTSIIVEINITGNPVLQSLTGLDNISSGTFNYLTLMDNSSLTGCSVQSVCDFLSGTGQAFIGNNAVGCNTEAQVEANCAAMPVELVSFQGRPAGHDISLEWKVGIEENLASYGVEHSTTGSNYEALKYINASLSNNYRYIHQQPGPGTHSYRLKMTDRDGAFNYSPVVVVDIEKTNVSVYPNPTDGTVFIDDPEGTVGEVSVYNSVGKLVKSRAADQAIDLSDMPKGMYQVGLQTEAGRFFYAILLK